MRYRDQAVTDAGGVALRYGGLHGAPKDGLLEPVARAAVRGRGRGDDGNRVPRCLERDLAASTGSSDRAITYHCSSSYRRSPRGRRFAYCNSGFILLGLVIEELGGVAYQDSCKRGSSNGPRCPTRASCVSTRFPNAPALNRDLILGRKWRERFLRPHVQTPTAGVFYGLGVWIHQRPERQRFHFLEGGDAGGSFASLHGSDSGVEYTVACNAPPGASEIVKLLDDAIAGLDRG